MKQNKTQPTTVDVNEFLATVSSSRSEEAQALINVMHQISGLTPVMWGSSIIGFGSQHYKYEIGREGDMPILSFSPRKVAITIYFSEGFDRYSTMLQKLGKFKASVSCLYINKLADIDTNVLRKMLEQSYALGANTLEKPTTVEEYVAQVPVVTRALFDELRSLVKGLLPDSREVFNYGIVGYKTDDKRARVFISGWKDHVAVYPIPKNEQLQNELKPYTKGKGTLWFSLTEPLPKKLISRTVKALAK